MSTVERAGRTYVISFVAAMALYAVAVGIMVLALNRLPEGNPWRYVVALLPVLPALGGLWAFMRFLRHMDELQRRLHFEAFGFSLAATSIVTFTLGLLNVAGLPTINLTWVLPLAIMLWGLGLALANRRYA